MSAEPQKRHERCVDNLVKRLESKGRSPEVHRLYGVGGYTIGELDVMTTEHRKGNSHVTYYEVKTGREDDARRTAQAQARHFYKHFLKQTYTIPRFVYVHADGTAEYWRWRDVLYGKKQH